MKNTHFGAQVDENGNCTFRVFAPHAKKVVITLNNDQNATATLDRKEHGFHEFTINNLAPDMSYSYEFDGSKKLPDPASLWQPKGVTTDSTILNHHKFDWNGDNFSGLPLNEMIIYEAHVGTFSPEGTLNGVISKLNHLSELGINTLQLMPVAQFSGPRGWGNETLFPYAVHDAYGTPDDLKSLVKECHKRSISIILDMSFCQSCFVADFAMAYDPLFSNTNTTDQGKALNFDEQHSNGVREFYIQCVLSWLGEFHVDGIHINNAHNIQDQSPIHFLEELSSRIRKFEKDNNRICVLIVDNKHNSPRPVMSYENGGFGVDALWNNDFHHAMHSRMTGDIEGEFCDYSSPEKLVSTMQHGFAFRGQFSKYYNRIHGCNKYELAGSKFIVFSQNHMQTTTTHGDCREIKTCGYEAAKLCAGATLLSPYTPMLFMGEEYGETAPFKHFASNYIQSDNIMQPLADEKNESAFAQSCLDWKKKDSDKGRLMFSFYKKLIKLRREHPTLKEPCHSRCQVHEVKPGLILMIRNPSSLDKRFAAIVYNFNSIAIAEQLEEYMPHGVWSLKLYSAARAYGGFGPALDRIMPKNKSIELAPHSFALYINTPSPLNF